MCNWEYIRCYKDQKAYSNWESGFFGPIYVYETCTKKIMCFYTLQLKHRKLWLTFRKYGLLSIIRVKPKIRFYVLGVCVWQMTMKDCHRYYQWPFCFNIINNFLIIGKHNLDFFLMVYTKLEVSSYLTIRNIALELVCKCCLIFFFLLKSLCLVLLAYRIY